MGLHEADPTGPCQWDRFFDDLDGQVEWTEAGVTAPFSLEGRMDLVHWDRIIVAGWSQGAASAVWIDLTEQVSGLFMLDAPSDMCLMDAANMESGRGASYYSDLVDPPVLEPSGAAPRFGAYHVRSPAPAGAWEYDADGVGVDTDGDLVPESPDANRPVAWDNLFPDHSGTAAGLQMPSCDDQPWDATVTEAEPAGPTGIPWLKRSAYPVVPNERQAFLQLGLRTNQDVDENNRLSSCGPHESVALSHRPLSGVTTPNCMPDGTGDYAQAPEAAHVFEAYVQGFCALGEE